MNSYNIKFLVFFLVISTFIYSCGGDNNDNPAKPETNTIVDAVSKKENLSMLTDALIIAGLDSTLKGEGNFTFFAPTNDAFQFFLDGNNDWNSLSDIPSDTLRNVLLFHILNQKIEYTNFKDTYLNTLATGPKSSNLSLQVQVEKGVLFNGSAKPIENNLESDNGIIHTIDKVMIPPNVATLLLNNENLTMLVAAMTDDRSSGNLLNMVRESNNFTIFAPTNEAFEKMLSSEQEWSSLSDIPSISLNLIIDTHFNPYEVILTSELKDGQRLNTGGRPNFEVDLDDGIELLWVDEFRIRIITSDIQGTNGVIHIINTVLPPYYKF